MNIPERKLSSLTGNWDSELILTRAQAFDMYKFQFLSQTSTRILYSNCGGKYCPISIESLLSTTWSTSLLR